jgi:hypothetical protein
LTTLATLTTLTTLTTRPPDHLTTDNRQPTTDNKISRIEEARRTVRTYHHRMKRAGTALFITLFAVAAFADPPETVAITYRVSKANEAKLKEVIDNHWATVTRLELVTAAHQLYRGDGFFLEIFTWKDAAIPDHAPPAVTALWGEMTKLVDKGGLRIDQISEVRVKAKE